MIEMNQLIEGRRVIVGGSAGSFKTIIKILERLKLLDFHTLIFALHRPRNETDKLHEVFCHNCPQDLIEPTDHGKIEKGKIYLAPSNFHLLVEDEDTFKLSDGPDHYFSKPSIDLIFQSAAEVWKESLTGILLSGANEDGAIGLSQVKLFGGRTVIQDPRDCLVDTMPKAAHKRAPVDAILSSDEIINLFGRTLEV
jgi:two-component system, chemotaxis family, protein-glutamate methylesterase/glutaminase